MTCLKFNAHGLTPGRPFAALLCGTTLACIVATTPARADVVGEGDVSPLGAATPVDPSTPTAFLPLDGGITSSDVLVGRPPVDSMGVPIPNAGGGFGILSIDNPAFTLPLTSPNGQIGVTSQDIGQATVSGFFSEWIVQEFMTVGVEGQGFLNITTGARVRIDNTATPDPIDARVGELDGSQGFVTINGLGSQWRHNVLNVGDRGHGSIIVTAGGRLETADEAILGVERDFSGDNALGTAYVEVSGTGSRWNVGDSDITGGDADDPLIVADEGRADIYVRAGGMIRVADDAIVGNLANANGSVTVSDVNSLFWSIGTIRLASTVASARGELHIDSGGEVRADAAVVVGGRGLIELYSGLPNTPVSVLRTPVVTNAGVIRGSGRIEAATVNNSGDIRNATYTDGYRERLLFSGAVNNSENIESIGGEMEFEGAVANNGANADIFAEDAILRFNNGLNNNGGRLTFDNTIIESPVAVASAGEFVVAASESELIGSLTFGPANVMFVEIGDEFSRIDVSNIATLDGDLSISLGDGYVPRAGDMFEIIEAASVVGTFDDVLPPVLSGFNFTVSYFPQSVVVNVNAGFVFNANWNGDAIVDGADLAIWQMNFGMMVPPGTNGDANGDGVVNGDDLLIWQQHLGLPQAAPAASPVPEPGSVVMLLMAMVGAAGARRRSRAA